MHNDDISPNESPSISTNNSQSELESMGDDFEGIRSAPTLSFTGVNEVTAAGGTGTSSGTSVGTSAAAATTVGGNGSESLSIGHSIASFLSLTDYECFAGKYGEPILSSNLLKLIYIYIYIYIYMIM